MEQHSIKSKRTTALRLLALASVLVAGAAAVIVGSLAAARTDARLGAELTDRPLMSATAAVDAASADRGGDRLRNGRLAYAVFVHRQNEIFTIGPRGRGKQRLTHNNHCDMHPAWSPSGRRIAFTSCRNPGGIFLMRANGTHSRLAIEGDAFWPAWSPSGRRIVFGCYDGNDFEICTIRRDGTHRRQVTDNDADDQFPEWSSRGRIGYTSTADGDEEIYTIKPNGADRRQLTHNATGDFGPAFSPSGTRIVYAADLATGSDLYIKPVAGGPRRAVTHSSTRFEDIHSWSPNGRRICYVQDHGGSVEVYTSKPNGKGKVRITHNSLREEWCDWGTRPHH